MRYVSAIRAGRGPAEFLLLGERSAEEGRGGGKDVGYDRVGNGVRREIDEARGLETVQNGPGGCEAFSGRAVKKEGEIHEL